MLKFCGCAGGKEMVWNRPNKNNFNVLLAGWYLALVYCLCTQPSIPVTGGGYGMTRRCNQLEESFCLFLSSSFLFGLLFLLLSPHGSVRFGMPLLTYLSILTYFCRSSIQLWASLFLNLNLKASDPSSTKTWIFQVFQVLIKPKSWSLMND